MDKQDRRVRKTREAIKEAFLDLIAARGFDALTVQDVSDAADINRSTFYAHFQDKFDLLDRTIREVLEKLVEDIRPEQMLRLPWMAYREGEAHPSYLVFFRHIREHQRLYTVMLGEHGNPLFRRRMTSTMREILGQLMPRMHPDIGSIKVSFDVLMSYLIGAEIELASWWVNTGMTVSEEEMALQLTCLNLLGPFRAGNLPLEVVEDNVQ